MDAYFCTRPRLAARLMAAGFECERLPNPYCDGFFVWEFPDSEELRAAVTAYFDSLNKGGDAD